MNEPYFQQHVFFCTNLRENGEQACENYNASEIRAYAKQRIKDLGLNGKGRVRINTSGCLDRCSEGPVMVVYPEGVWYTYVDRDDVDEIISEHLQNGRIVKRLQI
ncbi:MAG: (2Fe-2S) ferredoxin domain-containing protein [Gammaproteobacteria bacterium]|nr:(2Fe-2S) ferredoxin domain-containing protein [Gammaproteobacteria bacterium]